MEKTNKRKAKAVALATAAVLVLAGTIAYLADASGTIRNVFDNEHIRVQINETGVEKDAGDKGYTVLPGTSESKDPTITVDTDTDAYVFAVVKDTINSHKKDGETEATKLVDYTIADGWTLLDEGGESSEFGPKTIKKYVDILNEKTTGDLVVNPKDPNTKIYYRIVHGNELTDTDHDVEGHRFTYNLLTNDQISYPTTLTNEDMNLLNSISEKEQKALIFQTWAIQMEPFCPAEEVAEADPETADQKQYAKDAWNETTVVPTGVTVSQAQSLTTVKVGETLPLTATVLPKNAVDKTVTWTSSDESIATVDANGVVTGVAKGGPVTITATATAGDNVTGTYEVTVTAPVTGHIKWQVQLHSYDSATNTATFWPAAGNTYGKQPHDGDCICKCTWEEIVDGTHDFSNCHCTKTVTIDDKSNPDIFNALDSDVTCGELYNSLQNDARKWSSTNQITEPTYQNTLTAMQNAWDITGVTVSNFDLLSSSDVAGLSNSERKLYKEDGTTQSWWLASTSYGQFVVVVGHDGGLPGAIPPDGYGRGDGIAPYFSISK